MTETGFDYNKFLEDNGYNKNRQRPFSHGTLREAISKYLFDKVYKYQELKLFSKVDALYKLRKKADYEKERMDMNDLETSLDDAEKIIAFINKIEG